MEIIGSVQTFGYQAASNGKDSFVRLPPANVKDCPKAVKWTDGTDRKVTRVVGFGAVADKIAAIWEGGKKSASRIIDISLAKPRMTDNGLELVALRLPTGETDRFYEQAEADSSIPDRTADDVDEPAYCPF